FALCLVALAMLAVLPACSKAIKTEGVTGVITYNGEPLADATVKFIPTDATGSQSYGKTNEKGEYKLQTLLGAADAGTTPGDYVVTVDCVDEVETGRMKKNDDGEDVPETEEIQLVPARYLNGATSGLTATVVKGSNTFNFDLTSEE
ncbi:MAG: carboxypeptidase regulatory-like domain-containing protein, partial [Thermoguttaceae bacterium]|nr:carboxypeptidase regulatory-like domain-containing protein [Thermoguttaceae bacterium]